MTSYDTPRPITAFVDVALGKVRIAAGPRMDTTVDVRPADPAEPGDVTAADNVVVEFDRGRLVVKAPSPPRRRAGSAAPGGAVLVTVELPEDSELRVASVAATFVGTGRLGECRFDSMQSDIRLDRAGALRIKTARGEIIVGSVAGNAKVNIRNGAVRIDEIDGAATIQNDSGESVIGEITGTLRMAGTTGDLLVGRVLGDVEARTAHGNIRIDEAVRGEVTLISAFGKIEIGIPKGTAVHLDARTMSGHVRNSLDGVGGPADTDEVLRLKAQTFGGDVIIRRA